MTSGCYNSKTQLSFRDSMSHRLLFFSFTLLFILNQETSHPLVKKIYSWALGLRGILVR